MFKINNKSARKVPVTSLGVFIVNFKYFAPFYKVSGVDFKQVDVY